MASSIGSIFLQHHQLFSMIQRVRQLTCVGVMMTQIQHRSKETTGGFSDDFQLFVFNGFSWSFGWWSFNFFCWHVVTWVYVSFFFNMFCYFLISYDIWWWHCMMTHSNHTRDEYNLVSPCLPMQHVQSHIPPHEATSEQSSDLYLTHTPSILHNILSILPIPSFRILSFILCFLPCYLSSST